MRVKEKKMKAKYLLFLMTMAGASLCQAQEPVQDTSVSEKITYDFPLSQTMNIKASFGELPKDIFAVSQKNDEFIINYLALVTSKENLSHTIHQFGANLEFSLANNQLLLWMKYHDIKNLSQKGRGLIVYNHNDGVETTIFEKITQILENKPLGEEEKITFLVKNMMIGLPSDPCDELYCLNNPKNQTMGMN